MKAPQPPADLRARVLDAARTMPATPRAIVKRESTLVMLLGAAAIVVTFFAIGGADLRTRPPAFLATTALGWSAIAAAATWAGAMRGGQMLGRSGALLLTAALATGPSLLAWMIVGTHLWPGTVGYEAPMKAHLVCFALVGAMGLGPLVALAALRRRSDPVSPRASGAALGAVAGAWAGVMGDLHCPVSDALHVAIGHVAPVLFFALVGALLGRRVLGLRAYR